MGRLADARRRARRGAESTPPDAETPTPTPTSPPAPPPTTSAEGSGAGQTPETADAPEAAATVGDAPDDTHAAPDAAAPENAALNEAGPDPASDATAPDLPASTADEAFAGGGGVPASDGDAPRVATRYVLPSSGLAEEILAAATPEPAPLPTVAAPQTAPAPAPVNRAHQFTFFAAPEREAHEQVEANEHLVTFIVGSEEYGVDVRLVQEIIRVPAVTAVPRAPAFVRGVINLRGRIIPVIDLKTKLGLGHVDAAHRRARVLVVRLKGRLVGLLVDGASQVLKVPVSVIEAAPEEVVEIESHFLRGVAKLDGRLIILVDLLEVLAPELRAEGVAP